MLKILILCFWFGFTITTLSIVYVEAAGRSKGNQVSRTGIPSEQNTNGPIIAQTVKNGARNIVLECPFMPNSTSSASQFQQVQWRYNKILLENTTRRYQIGSKLFISIVDKEKDGGVFECEVFNNGAESEPLTISLNIIWISSQTSTHLLSPNESSSSLTTIKSGTNNLILECFVEGTSSFQFNWYKNGLLLNLTTTSKHNQRLHLPNVTLEDNGSYYCTAQNDAGKAETFSKFDLIVTDKNNNNPQIQVSPQNLVGKKHEDGRFDCTWTDRRIGTWYFNGSHLSQNTSRLELLNNGSLLIRRIREADEGIYKCSHGSGSELQSNISYVAFLRLACLKELSIDSLDPVPKIPGNKLALPENSSAEIVCNQPEEGSWPIPRLWWEDPRGNLMSNSKSNVLRIPILTTDYNGIYTCFAQNIAKTTRISFELVSTVKPTIVSFPLNRTVHESSSTKFHCPFLGAQYPVSRVHWLRNGLPIVYDNRIVNQESNSTLLIKSVEPLDGGDYTCEIITPGHLPVRSDDSTGRLIVTESLKFSPVPLDRKLEVNTSQKIHCRARGSPMPIIKWTKDSETENHHRHLPSHITASSNGILHFQNVQKTDAGTYTCTAKNSQGVISSKIQVDVFASPKFLMSPKNPTEALEGDSVLLQCLVTGDPPPTIQWDKSLEMIDASGDGTTESRFSVLPNGSLWIRQVLSEDHEKRFGCTAGNSGGFSREEVQLFVIRTNSDALESQDGTLMTRTISITLSVAAGYMLLVIGLMLWCRYRQLKRKQEYLIEVRKEIGDTELLNGGTITGVNGNGTIPPGSGSNGTPKILNGNGIPNGHPKKPSSVKSDGEITAKSNHSSKLASATASVISHRSGGSSRSVGTSCYDRITIPRSELSFVLLLGHGEFGEVFLAKAKLNEGEGGGESLVMVKALQTREESALLEFKREIELYYKLNHENVSRLWGLCREMDPHYMIMEYSDWGDLKQFLLATRPDHPKTPKPPPLSTQQILHTIRQVAIGMEHLSNHRFLHKDLATRNCLISTGLRIQISNPSLNKDTYSPEYVNYRNQTLPLRWLPYEAVLEDDFSTKSDVWSWAVMVWEVIHKAALPFPNSSNDHIVELLEKNEICWNSTTELPDGTPKSLKNLLQKCWDSCPSGRPTFTTIVLNLDEIIKELDI